MSSPTQIKRSRKVPYGLNGPERFLMVALIIVLVIIAVLVIAAVLLYNNLVTLRNRVDNAWAQINVQLQRRCDLIPNLVETVKGYMHHERNTLDAVTKARTSVVNAQTPEQAAAADGELTSALKTLFAVAESYPDLKASKNFSELQAQLAETEDKISYMRQSYNDTVMRYNTAIQTFPGMLFKLKFAQRESFQPTEGASEVPDVKFE